MVSQPVALTLLAWRSSPWAVAGWAGAGTPLSRPSTLAAAGAGAAAWRPWLQPAPAWRLALLHQIIDAPRTGRTGACRGFLPAQHPKHGWLREGRAARLVSRTPAAPRQPLDTDTMRASAIRAASSAWAQVRPPHLSRQLLAPDPRGPHAHCEVLQGSQAWVAHV